MYLKSGRQLHAAFLRRLIYTTNLDLLYRLGVDSLLPYSLYDIISLIEDVQAAKNKIYKEGFQSCSLELLLGFPGL